MHVARMLRPFVLGALLLSLLPPQSARAAPAWIPAAPPGSARASHAATTLADGRVLVVGGFGDVNTTEYYDPATNSWRPAGSLTILRGAVALATLGDGRALAVGATNASGPVAAERFDPASASWRQVAALALGTEGTLTTLADGRALYVADGRAAVYDPAADSWTPTAPLPVRAGGGGHAATTLRDGRVLVVGGVYGGASGEVYGEARPTRMCFAETGHCLDGAFLAYWRANGGLARHGYPLTAERWEILEDGNPYVVQYFERSRFEHHPENSAPYDVLLGHFGRQLYLLDPSLPRSNAAPPIADALYFHETGHNVRGRFLAHWQANGSTTQLGLPLSEELLERLEDGKEYMVQYFERARLEYHPEHQGTPHEVLLGHFGRRILAAREPSGQLPHPLIGRLATVYAANTGVRVRLNAPTGVPGQVAAVTQQFEKGWMIWRADTDTIYVLASEAQLGSIPVGGALTFADTWDEGLPEGGGPGPRLGLYEPRRGFGKVWRDHQQVRQALGYALTPDEQSQTITLQAFVGGVVLDAPELRPYTGGLLFIVYTNGRHEVQYPGF